jgi:hypothetical protein
MENIAQPIGGIMQSIGAMLSIRCEMCRRS